MAHTDRATVAAQAIFNKITTNKTTLGLDYVLYGQQNLLPSGLGAVVEATQKTRALQGVGGPGGRTLNLIRVLITVYNNRIGDEATQRLVVEEASEDIEHLLHQDTSLEVNGEDTVIHGYVTIWDPGIAFKANSMFRAVQMEWQAQTKTQLTELP